MPAPFVMVAPNGLRRQKSDHPAVPITIAEAVDTARACHAAGADAVHLHVRDAEGGHTLDVGLYREALAEMARALPGLPVQVTTEAGGMYDAAAQLDLIERLQPPWVSLALREAARDRDVARRLYAAAATQGTRLQHIIYDAEDAALLRQWQGEGVLGQEESVILVLGRYARDMNSDPDDLAPLHAALPPVGKWMVCAFGRNEHASLLRAAAMGADLRVGFENSLQRPDGTQWADNAASVAALRAALG